MGHVMPPIAPPIRKPKDSPAIKHLKPTVGTFTFVTRATPKHKMDDSELEQVRHFEGENGGSTGANLARSAKLV
jgi:hypothetical protein